MKKKIMIGLGIVLAVSCLSGCIRLPLGSESTDDYSEEIEISSTFEDDEHTEEAEEETEETEETEITEKTEKESGITEDESDEANPDTYTFEDLSKYRFEFSSGAGAWATEFTIEKDGYFKGIFYDSNMGDVGNGYENGTRYYSSFTGHFTDWTQISGNCYEMTLADINYRDEVGHEEIDEDEGILYIYTDAYGLTGSDTFRVYFPGTPIDAISEEVYSWLVYNNTGDNQLDIICIENVGEQYGIYSIERPEPLEDAQMYYNSYELSYEFYLDAINNAETQSEMLSYSENLYRITDSCLNYIWDLVKYNTDEDEFQEILEEQREWIANKDIRQSEVEETSDDADMTTIECNKMLAEMTMERCEQLMQYLE